MEAVTLPGADEVDAGTCAGVQARDLGLRRDGLEGEQRMLGRDSPEDLRRIDLFGGYPQDPTTRNSN